LRQADCSEEALKALTHWSDNLSVVRLRLFILGSIVPDGQAQHHYSVHLKSRVKVKAPDDVSTLRLTGYGPMIACPTRDGFLDA
jgi:hypothetical protein